MAGKTIAMSKVKQLLQLHKSGTSNRQIAKMLKISRDKVNELIKTANSDPIGIDGLLKLDDPVLDKRLHPGNPAYSDERMDVFLKLLPDFIEKLNMRHVTRYMLWEEYKEEYPNGYSRAQFYFHLKQNLKALKVPTTVLKHEPGLELYIDFAGDTLSYIDADTGEIIKVQTFVSTLACTDYAFAMCVPSQKIEDFLYALSCALEFYGGVPKIVVPDNLKSAVVQSDRYEPKINKAMEDMGNYYGFVVVPCQVAKPTHKALVENQVKIIYHRIYAKLQQCQFFSLNELNKAVYDLLVRHNQTRMQQRPYTREEHFYATEKDALKPLPKEPYEMKRYADVTVQQNGHVYLSCDKHYYSVPYTFIGFNAKIIFTATLVNVYVKGKQVAVHKRIRRHGYSSLDEHLASNSLAITQRSVSYYIEKAKKVSIALSKLIERIFESTRANIPPECYYKTCEMMLRLQKDYETEIFDNACEICLENEMFTGHRLENVIKTLINTKKENNHLLPPEPTNHVNMRGSQYFV